MATTCQTTTVSLEARLSPTPTVPLGPSSLIGSMTSLSLAATLSCEIHPIFARRYWFAISDGEYEQFKPALQLTTMLMSTPACLGFFATLLFADRAIDETVSEEGKKKLLGRITKEAHLTPFKAERVGDMFCDLEGIFKFTCQAIDDGVFAYAETDNWTDLTDEESSDLEWQRHVEKPAVWSARMSLKLNMTVDKIGGEEKEFCWPEPSGPVYNPYDDERDKPLQDPRTRMTPTTITLSTQLLLHLKKKDQSAENTLRSNFVIAACLIHELAHAVEYGRPECREWDVDEAIFPGEEKPELGIQAEMRIFGGVVFVHQHADNWLQFTQATDNWEQDYAVPSDYLARIQQQEFWDSVSSTHIPSTEIVHFPTTMPQPAGGLVKTLWI